MKDLATVLTYKLTKTNLPLAATILWKQPGREREDA